MFTPQNGLRPLLVCLSAVLFSVTTVQAQAPVAEFSGSPTVGPSPLAVNFTDLSTGAVSGWVWAFGDTNGSLLQNPAHTYLSSGTFSVSLTVTGTGGSDTTTKVDYIVAIGATNSDFTGTPTSGTAPLDVSFTDTSTPGASAWNWDFGDGGSSSAQNPTHTYAAPGNYTVSLAATGLGGTDCETKIDYVSATQGGEAVFRNGGTNPAAYAAAPPVIGTTWVAEVETSAFPGTFATIVFGRSSSIPGVNTIYGRLLIDPSSNVLFNSIVASSGGVDSHTFPLPSNVSLIGRTGFTQAMCFGPGGTALLTNAVDLVVGTTPVIAAPAAGLAGTPTLGNVPLTVAFSDTSTGSVTGWSWDFGDGGSSTSANPTHTYTDGGTYAVSLVVEGPGGFDLVYEAGFVTVNDPAPDFSATPLTGNSPLSVAYTDLTTGNVTSWSWDFGDANVSTLQNPTNTYVVEGTYTVSLTATGPGGSNTETKVDYVTVSAGPPTTNFSGSPLSGIVPLSVNFTDLSVGTITSWSWDFGDLGVSSLQNPSHTYAASGTYTVVLTATGPGGSGIETKVDYVTASPSAPAPDFSGTPLTGTEPVTVNFTDLTSGLVSSWSWDFGDGGSSVLQNPSHTYTLFGTYTVALSATGPGGSVTETKIDYVVVLPVPPIADFSGTPTSGFCPLGVAFSDLSSGTVTGWNWDFGDTASSTLQNPSHIYGVVGTYTVSLTSTGPGGVDGETKVGYITVLHAPPATDFLGTPLTGTEPLTVTFTDLTTGTASSWSWSFGDLGSSTLQNPTHMYAVAGTYTVALTATGPGGSTPETKTDYVTVLPPAPVADFSGTPLSGDQPLVVNFSDATTGIVTGWNWSFGDAGSSSLQNPSHTYASAGTYTVGLTATGPGGSDLESKIDYVTVLSVAPVAEFSGSPLTGVEPLIVVFTDLSSGTVTGWSWSFGDSASSSLQNPSHAYASQGTYTVAMTATGPAGTDLQTKVDYVTVMVAPVAADFVGTPLVGSEPLTVDFADTTTGSVTSWLWNFGDGGSATLQNPSHIYSAAGTYTVTLAVTGPGGSDTEVKADYVTVAAAAPTAVFSGTPLSGNQPLVVTFSDLSTGIVTSWNWTFGDGGSSLLQNPTHTYLLFGTYSVGLTATGPAGSDLHTETGYVTVLPPAPMADFVGTPTVGQAPLTVVFTDQSTGLKSSWAWDFGDSNTSTLQNPNNTYQFPGTYTVSMTVLGTGGSTTETKPSYIIATPGLLLDGGFELQTAGTAPGTPWGITSGTSHIILPDSAITSDNGMPADGANWAALSADGSNAATPPSNPGGMGTAPVGASGIAQSFLFDPADPVLVLSAAFILNDAVASLATNDFMSVDITDGLTTYNLYHADSFSAFPNTSGRYGLPMTVTSNIGTNLALSFPSATAATLMTLAVQVGNGGDGADSSIGCVDGMFSRNLASITFRNGTGINPQCFVADPPVIGTTWAGQIDHRDRPSATAVVLLLRGAPAGPVNVGFGELLVGSPVLFDIAQAADASGITTFGFSLPADLSLVGMAASQGLILGVPDQTFCNALDLQIGFAPPLPVPAADFSASATLGVAPLAVTFSDLSTGTVSSWNWDFGDSATSTLQNPSHTYNAVGTYMVGLRVTGPGGLDIERKFDYIQAQ